VLSTQYINAIYIIFAKAHLIVILFVQA